MCHHHITGHFLCIWVTMYLLSFSYGINSFPEQIFIPWKSRLNMQPVHILTHNILNDIFFHEFDQSHVSQRWPGIIKCSLHLWSYSLFLQCPHSFWSSKVRDPRWCTNTRSCVNHNVFWLVNNPCEFCHLLVKLLGRIENLRIKTVSEIKCYSLFKSRFSRRYNMFYLGQSTLSFVGVIRKAGSVIHRHIMLPVFQLLSDSWVEKRGDTRTRYLNICGFY